MIPTPTAPSAKASSLYPPTALSPAPLTALPSGPIGADLRSFLKFTDDKERREYWEKYVAETIPGVALDAFQFVQSSALDKPLEFHYKVTAHQYSHQAGSLLLVRPRVVGTFARALRRQAAHLSHRSRCHRPLARQFRHHHPSPATSSMKRPTPSSVDVGFRQLPLLRLGQRQSPPLRTRIHRPPGRDSRPTKAADFRQLESAILSDEKDSAVLKKQ